MNIAPQRDLVLVELYDPPERLSPGGLVILRDRQPSHYARVLAIGPDVRDVEVGRRYVVSRLQGIDIAGRLLLPESAVLAEVAPPNGEASNPNTCRHPELGCAGSCRAEHACND